MLQPIEYFLYIMVILDIGMTFINARAFHKKFPDRDYRAIENNVALRFFWDKFGFEKGTVAGMIFSLIIMFFIIKFLLTEQLFWAILGAYSVVQFTHYNVYKQIKKIQIPKPEVKNVKKK